MTASLTRSITTRFGSPGLRLLALSLYYLMILGGVMILGTLNAFTTTSFVYQGF